VRDQPYYLLTAACYDHACHMRAHERRTRLQDLLFEAFMLRGLEITAWVILPNHYHILAHVTEWCLVGDALRFVHHTTASEWNSESGSPGRKLWYRYTDRAIRSERHYMVSLNYIHYNPVKHHWAASPYDWAHSSVHWYLAHHGREWLRELWSRYPLRSYGKDWDDSPGEGP